MPRKRHKDRPRTASGRLSRAYQTDARDNGTRQLQAKRQAAVGWTRDKDGKPIGNDPTLSATAAGILYARGVLDLNRYTAALKYRAIYCLLFGVPWPSNVSSHTIPPERYLTRARRLFLRLAGTEDPETGHRRNGLLDRAELQLVSDVCVYDQLPEQARHEPLLRGLSAVARVIGR
jgi:hypothetical protein